MADLKVTIGTDISQYQAGVQQAGQVTKQFSNDATRDLAEAAKATSQLGGSAQSSSMQFMQMRSGISAARDGVMAFTLGGQAAERSLMAMGHHINSLVNETGSFAGAMGALASSLMGPGGIILGLTLAMELFSKYRDAQKKAAETQDDFTKALNEGIKSASQEASHLMILYQASQNDALSRNDRLTAVKELQKEYPAYFGNMSQEAILAGQAAGAYDRLTQSIINSAVVKAGQESLSESLKPLIQLTATLQAEQFKADQAYEARKKAAPAPTPGIRPVDPNSGTPGLRQFTPSTQPTHPVAQTFGIVEEDGELKSLEEYKNKIQDKIKSNAAAVQTLLGQYGVASLLKNQEVKPKITHEKDRLKEQIDALKKELDNAAEDGKPAAFLENLALKLQNLEIKLKSVNEIIKNAGLAGGGKLPLINEEYGNTMSLGHKGLGGGADDGGYDDINLPVSNLNQHDSKEEIADMHANVEAVGKENDAKLKLWYTNKHLADQTKADNSALKEITHTIGGGLTNAFMQAMQGTQSFVQAMGQFLAQLIEKLIAAAAAALILSIAIAAFTGGTALASFSGIFGQLSGFSGVLGGGNASSGTIPMHASGGIATKAHIGMIGEAGPEAIIPLSRMNEFTGGGGTGGDFTVTHKLSGSDLLILINRATKSQSRKS